MIFGSFLEIFADDEAIVASSSGQFNCKFFKETVAREVANLGEGQRQFSVIIASDDLISVITALACIDGRVRTILLADPHLPAEALARFGRHGQFDVVFSERSDLADVGLPAIADLAALCAMLSSVPVGPTQPTEWMLATSGTTGSPKLVRHTLTSLTATTKPPRGRQARPVWGMLYDFSRFAGLQVVLQSLFGRGLLVVPDSRASLEDRLDLFARNGVDYLSATPTMWRKMMMSQSRPLQLKSITLGGEVADQKVIDALKTRHPSARVTHIYASTEAGVGFAVSDGREGFPLAFLRNPPQGIALRIVSDELQIRNPSVMPRYVGSKERFADDNGWVRTGDCVTIVDDRVKFSGRLNGSINVGGNKVLPEKVERVLKMHDSVAEARVYGWPSPIAGMLVAAEIQSAVPVADEADFKKSVRDFAAIHLDRHETPFKITVVAGFDINSSGKLIRK